MAKAKVEFTRATLSAMHSVAEGIAPDMDESDVRNSAVMAETVLDADRLRTAGYGEAMDEIDALIKAHGWDRVRNAAARHMRYA